MKRAQFIAVVFLGLALIVTGCGKKSDDQAGLSGTGFDSLSSTEELAQLPQNNTYNQQASVEVLPIEVAPVTQSAIATMPTAITSSTIDLNREQQIQTALKNAGFYQGKIDGKIGPKTKQAIEQFQANQGLKVDGKVGPKTWAAMQSYMTAQAAATE